MAEEKEEYSPGEEREEETAGEDMGKVSEQTADAGVEDAVKTDVHEPEQKETPEKAEGDSGKSESESGESEGGASEDKKDTGKKGKKLLNRVKKDKKDEKIEELNDRLLRNMAEFENFRNRSEKEKTAMFEIGAKSVVEKILPVVDNFERGLDAVPDEEKENAFVKGMEAVYKQFSAVLAEIGVVPIEAVGKEFDPNLHNAVMHDEDDSMGANLVSEELQKGYMYKDSVVRHSMVKVVN